MHRQTLPILAAGSFILLSVFLVWGVLVVGPVLVVEFTYQYRKLLSDVFHTTALRGAVVPHFRFRAVTTQFPDNAVEIPSLFLDEPIVFNVDPNNATAYTAALKRGIAHASATGLPGSGKVGYYFAHSSSPLFVSQLNAVFYLLGKVKPGATIILWHRGERFEYIVTDTRVTDPEDVSFLTRQYPKETIVLQTCWPPATTAKRLLVFAETTSTISVRTP